MSAHNTMKEIAADLGVNNLYDLYRAVYDGTACGPSIGVTLRCGTRYYCDSLRTLGTFAAMAMAGREIEDVLISSIVEGTDIEVPTRIMKDDDASVMQFYELVEEVDTEASGIWEDHNA